MAPGRDLVRCAGRPRLRRKKGAIEQLYTAPPESSIVVCLDEMGPQASKSYPGQRLVKPAGPRAERAKQEIDYGRRDVAGYVFGALQPATGAAFTATYERRTTANWVDFLEQVERWIEPGAERVYAVVDNLNIHAGMDVLLFALAHPRWEFVFQPKYAAYLNLIEPWWKVLRSLALKGRRFDAWAEIEQAVQRATEYWNQHKHPFIWGRRRRHRTPRRLGIAAPPNAALI
ncbi:MAG TPA: IS630 family transposase [Roseococcus sp.]|nr:IS630 family transposase [Roseococcus sp.]